MIKICTWNSQGDPTLTQEKAAILNYLATTNDVILLQECTHLQNPEVFNNIAAYYYVSGQAGAFNSRCSTAMISRLPFTPVDFYLPSGTGRCAIISQIQGISVATIHAQSGNDANSDIFSTVRRLYQIGNSFILGGDFNCPPQDLSYQTLHSRNYLCSNANRIPTSRDINFWEASWHASRSFTHLGFYRERLDYFIVSTNFYCSDIHTYHLAGGDHYPVLAEFRL